MPTAVDSSKSEKQEKLVVTVDKPIPFEFDMGHLAAFDANPLDPEAYEKDYEACIAAAARDAAQALINQVLTALPLRNTGDGVMVELPEPITPLPREKSIPKDKEPTKWELFAKKKGIAPKGKDWEGKKVYDDATGEWVPKWGYKGTNKDGEDDWLVEVDDKKTTADGAEADPRRLSREERKRNVKANERLQKANMKRSAGLAPKKGAGVGKNRKR